MYADDTNTTISGKTAIAMDVCLNNQLEKVGDWLIAKLILNAKKTKYMVICSTRDSRKL